MLGNKRKRGCGTITPRTPFGAPRRPPASSTEAGYLVESP